MPAAPFWPESEADSVLSEGGRWLDSLAVKASNFGNDSESLVERLSSRELVVELCHNLEDGLKNEEVGRDLPAYELLVCSGVARIALASAEASASSMRAPDGLLLASKEGNFSEGSAEVADEPRRCSTDAVSLMS